MRKLIWIVAIAVSAWGVSSYLIRRARAMQRAEDDDARATWDNEGGAPTPSNV